MRSAFTALAVVLVVSASWADEPPQKAAPIQELLRGVDTIFTGSQAPDFTLKSPAGREVTLSQYRGERPVALIFGSYT